MRSGEEPPTPVVLAAGARSGLFARGDGGTLLVAALFWGHEVAALLAWSAHARP